MEEHLSDAPAVVTKSPDERLTPQARRNDDCFYLSLGAVYLTLFVLAAAFAVARISGWV
jgi:hypothetical protein